MRNSEKRLLAILLILAILFSFSACKKGKNMWDPYGEESTASSVASGSSSGETVTDVVDENPYFSGTAVSVYTSSEDGLWPNSSVIEMGDCIGIFLEIPVYKDNAGSDQEPEYEYQLSIFDFDGNLISELDLSEYVDAGDIFYDAQGDYENKIHIYTGGSDFGSTQEVIVDKNGQIIEAKHDAIFQFGSNNIYDSEGNTYTISSDGRTTQITGCDSEGKVIDFLQLVPDDDINGGALCELNNTIYLSTTKEIYPIDFESDTLGEPIVFNAGRDANPLFLKQGIFFDKADGFYKFDMTTLQTRKILSWNDMDLDITHYQIDQWIPISDVKIIGVGHLSDRATISSGSYGSIEMVVLNKEEINPNLNKEVLILGGFNISRNDDLCSAVNQFNFQNTEYRIEMRDYLDGIDTSEFEGEEYYQLLYSQAAEQLNLDILNGEAPDMLCSRSDNSYFPIERFETQGLLLDLYEMSAEDEAFHGEDYVQSVLSLLEVDGKLYRFPMSFSMQGLVGPTRLVGDRSNWTMDEFNEFAGSLPEGAVVFPNQSKEYLMQYCLSSSMTSYVDYNQSLANFDSPEFCELLEFVKTYGGEEIIIKYDDPADGEDETEGYIDTMELMAQGMIAVDFEYVSNVTSMANDKYVFQEPVTYVGFPSSNQSGMVCSINNAISISADCDNPEAAWSFISFCISEKSQKENFMFGGAPIHQGVLEEKAYQILNRPISDLAYFYMMTEVTQEDVDQFLALVDSISALSGQDAEIMNIVSEEAQAYYEGAKTAEEVAAIIQNRVGTFVSEVS